MKPFSRGCLGACFYTWKSFLIAIHGELPQSFQIFFQSTLFKTPVILFCWFTQAKMLFIYLLLGVETTSDFLGLSSGVVLFFLKLFSILSTVLVHDK